MLKRIMDIGISALALMCLSPVILTICVMSWMKIGRPILFIQKRPGLHGRPFYMLKFRSMDVGEGDDESRLSEWGAFLRKTSLDELPGLWNVLKGEMSLVGPRPLLMEYLGHYSPEQARRHLVRPGLTGWAQVNGRNSLDWDERLALDVWYVDNHTIMLDLKIVCMTLSRVIRRDGVSHEGHATMPRFDERDKE